VEEVLATVRATERVDEEDEGVAVVITGKMLCVADSTGLLSADSTGLMSADSTGLMSAALGTTNGSSDDIALDTARGGVFARLSEGREGREGREACNA